MLADGALRGRYLALEDKATDAALPLYLFLLLQEVLLLETIEEELVDALVLLLRLDDVAHQGGNLLEALLLSLISHSGVHMGPLLMLTGDGELEILTRGADLACGVAGGDLYLSSLEVREEHLGVHALLVCCLLEEVCDLTIALLASNALREVVAIACLRLACECDQQVLLCLSPLDTFLVHVI